VIIARSADQPTFAMSRAVVLAALVAISPMDACTKVLKRGEAAPPTAAPEPPPPPVITSATAPPIWTAPDPGGPLPAPAASAAAAVGPDLAKARALASAGEHKKVRSLLEKKVKSGRASEEEAAVLLESCTVLKDKACVELVRTKHPELEGQ
jgi:hypothetical protein